MNRHNYKNKIGDFNINLPFKLNSQQIKTLEEIDDFIHSPKTSLTVSGYAGTGKTTLMEIVAKRYWWDRPIFFAATTHKAAAVLRSKVKKSVSTVNSLFGIIIETNMDGEDYDVSNKSRSTNDDNKLKRNSLVIIDEASMLSNENYEDVLFKCSQLNCKIIFLGDPAQLAPVNEGEISIVFRNEDTPVLEMTQIERTDNDFILEESMFVRESGEFSYQTKTNEDSGVHFINNTDKESIINVFDKFIPGLTTNPNHFRVLSYTNRNVEKLNSSIRTKLGYTSQIPYSGEPLMGYSNWGYIGGYKTAQYKFINSESYTMVKERETRTIWVSDVVKEMNNFPKDLKLTITEVEIKDDLGTKIVVPFIDIKSNEENMKSVRVLCQEKINLWMKYRKVESKLEKLDCLSGIHEIDELLFVNDNVRSDSGKLLQSKVIDFGYAHTIHKSQGSTFENVLINDVDIDNCTDTTIRRQLRYVALTRATKNVKIITNKI